MWLSLILPLVAGQSVAASQLSPSEILVLPPVGAGGRVPVVRDAISHQMATGTFKAPKVGDTVTLPNLPTSAWRLLKIGGDGTFIDRATAGACYWSYDSPRETTMMLEAAGHGMVYVNGEPRMGDIYDAGYAKIPVRILRGKNEFLSAGSRGRVRMKLVEPTGPAFIQANDATLPDVVVGAREPSTKAGIIVTNASATTFEGTLEISHGGRSATAPVRITPFANRKVAANLPVISATEPGKTEVTVSLKTSRGDVLHSQRFSLEVKSPSDPYRITFQSKMDNSVQYYAVRPAWPVMGKEKASALVLSVHGASVEAIGQAAAYGPKAWCNIVCPTNRRPYGFDWEDWGRIDAMEVLAEGKRRFSPNDDQIYLTGHSMGGHGTWYLGATYPDQFAAIGPAAGWITFWSYGGAADFPNPNPMEAMLLRATNVSDTLQLLPNYAQQGVFILHGDADETVPVKQARDMRERLSAFHRNLNWFEQPGGGHWYDATPDPGADCVDFAPMFDFFARNRIPSITEVKKVDFSTISPDISASSHWVKVIAQNEPFKTSRVQLEQSVPRRIVEGTTTNVRRLQLDFRHLPAEGTVNVTLDGTEIKDVPYPADGVLSLERGNVWSVAKTWSATDRSPDRNGGFKSAFNNGFVFVYGTKGTPAENAWSYARARFDAEQWWYRGNGDVEIYSDQDYRSRVKPDQSVILYGNFDTNRAYEGLLKECPIFVTREQIKTPDESWNSEKMAIVFTYPKPGSAVAMVGVVAGTGLVGARSTDRLGYFRAGVHYPDVFAYHADLQANGSSEIRLAGFFGIGWGFADGEFAWKN